MSTYKLYFDTQSNGHTKTASTIVQQEEYVSDNRKVVYSMQCMYQ